MSKYTRVYIEPSVKIIDASSPDVDYSLWLRSREPVCTYRTNLNTDKSELVQVGTEIINDESEYEERIRRMGLQYTNFKDYTFEIQGSTIFRDILFTLNKVPQWATSLRFINSLFKGFDTRNYPVSSEYKDVSEWEEQFDKYMDKIQETMVTDENRVEMPYSMSSRYWVKLNWKTLVGFLSMLKIRMPFFYEVYGSLFEHAIMDCDGIDVKKYYVPFIDSSIDQYFNHTPVESSGYSRDGDQVKLSVTMGLLLFSQFIRQQDSCIKGLYSMVAHDDPESFKHKMFYASTPINVVYTADYSRFMRTISNRTCWFSMSSGNDINSWSSVLNYVLENIDLSEFLSLLPCGKSVECMQCKFKEDVKFRNEGLELRNLPCGLALMRKDLIEKRKNYDNTTLSNFYEDAYNYFKRIGTKPIEI